MTERKRNINDQAPLVFATITTDGAGGVTLGAGSRGVASVALGAADNQVDVTFSQLFSTVGYVAQSSGTVASRLAHFGAVNPAAPGGLAGTEIFATTIDEDGVPEAAPDLAAVASSFTVVFLDPS